ncbi:MAG: hypothetical protein IJ250_07490, partial [Bacteroidales bacterium]|nr:hypothetical protein [Bacteroidales bacterium]
QRLCCFCNELQSRIELTDDKNRLKDLHFDAVTATGSNSSALYFEQYFANVPHIIRKNRTSVAVLDNHTDITGIEDDICLYFGLGCRNISCLFVPEDYDFTKIKQRLEKYSYYLDHHKYRNNYDYQQAVMIMNNIPFIQAGCMLLRQSTEIFSPVSVLNYICYESKEHLHKMLKTQQDNLQCTANAFGKMQQPGFTQYADGVDTMRWLMNV